MLKRISFSTVAASAVVGTTVPALADTGAVVDAILGAVDMSTVASKLEAFAVVGLGVVVLFVCVKLGKKALTAFT